LHRRQDKSPAGAGRTASKIEREKAHPEPHA
jgi:hypothetical protein